VVTRTLLQNSHVFADYGRCGSMEKTKILDEKYTNISSNKSVKEMSDCNSMPVEELRKHLGDSNLTDKQVEELRDALCVLIDKVLDSHFNKLLQ